ncbi:MurR/RpiR family transcriptional regulator [Solibacillus sp. FSL K6-1554]|uniref:MurR/RpiR family transcriptional regulator n=1 Tax=Solibacillus sp. FSL K6-1554 TaxID=2921472 RepID=UPI0009F546F6|nr:MurR/RpiR family transcriptional regulator [Solibacillus silvestris]
MGIKATTITERIEAHFNQLSKAQKKVAQFVLKNPTYVGVHSASEVGIGAGTSETTVIRFCYAIGLAGYAQLQKEVTMFVFGKNTNSTLGNYVASKEALFHEPQLAEKVMGQVSNQIINIAQQIDPDQFQDVTRRMHQASTIYLIGAGASQFAGQWLKFTLNILRPNVQVVETHTGALIRTLQEMDEDALVIVVSLHRYYKESIALAKMFHEQGAYTVAMTDSNVAPIIPHADTTFVLQQTELSTIDMMPALIAFMNTLVVGMVSHDQAYYEQQREKFDDFQNSFLADRWS